MGAPALRPPNRPLLVLVTGLQGTGKSTMADVAGRALAAPVLGHDWAMSGLRPYPEIQAALDAMGLRGHRGVGWSLLWALARSQLRRGSSVVLDGVARDPEVKGTRQLARDEGAHCVVVMTACADPGTHRARVEERHRSIPGWYELDWAHVERSRASWKPPHSVNLALETTDSFEENVATLRQALRKALAQQA